MAAVPQTYKNHTRWYPIWHFIAFPILAVNVIVEAIRLFKAPTADAGWAVLVALALVLAVLASRTMAVTLQDRLIRLEERLRLARLAPDLAGDIPKLTRDQLIGLRFASDSEVLVLARRCLEGELKARGDIKQEVKVWRPDYLRV